MTRVTCRLTAKNRHQLRNPTLGNRVCATLIFFWPRKAPALAPRCCPRTQPFKLHEPLQSLLAVNNTDSDFCPSVRPSVWLSARLLLCHCLCCRFCLRRFVSVCVAISPRFRSAASLLRSGNESKTAGRSWSCGSSRSLTDRRRLTWSGLVRQVGNYSHDAPRMYLRLTVLSTTATRLDLRTRVDGLTDRDHGPWTCRHGLRTRVAWTSAWKHGSAYRVFARPSWWHSVKNNSEQRFVLGSKFCQCSHNSSYVWWKQKILYFIRVSFRLVLHLILINWCQRLSFYKPHYGSKCLVKLMSIELRTLRPIAL